jgi:predicted secreted hydrolase
MKKTIFILILLCLSLTFFNSAFAFSFKNQPLIDPINTQRFSFQNGPFNYRFNPEDINLEDDAYHGADSLHFTEWWYFDASFENGYTAQMSVRVVSALNQGVVFCRLDIYRHGILVSHNQRIFFMKDFYASTEAPLIRLAGKEVLSGYINETTGNWTFDLTFNLQDSSAHLHYVGRTKGWKAQLHGDDWWGVILPRADVTGKLTVNDQDIIVQGTGYHDHNWEVTMMAGLNLGWFWGKINSANYTMTWSTIFTTRVTKIPVMVINEDGEGYRNIPSEYIEFDPDKFAFENGRFIPYEFDLSVNYDDIMLDVTMDVLAIHHVRIFGIVNYWRYHLHCTGSITINGVEEPIDRLQIAECIRFR